MTYPFECQSCGLQDEVIASVGQKYDIPKCVQCNTVMQRVWTPPHISVEKAIGFVPAFDKDVKNKRELADAKKAYADKHGTEPIEVGNETKALHSLRPKLQN